jgi:hypothetical protein
MKFSNEALTTFAAKLSSEACSVDLDIIGWSLLVLHLLLYLRNLCRHIFTLGILVQGAHF